MMRVHLKKWQVWVGVTFVVIALVVGTPVWWLLAANEAVKESYAQWDAALSLIHYMRTHDGAWPSGWDAVRSACEAAPDLRGPGWDNLRSRVEIDFTADPRQLAKADQHDETPPFRVVWLKSGSKAHWRGKEPNGLILSYLKGAVDDETTMGIAVHDGRPSQAPDAGRQAPEGGNSASPITSAPFTSR